MKKYYAKEELMDDPVLGFVHGVHFHYFKGDELNVVGEETSVYMVDVMGQTVYIDKDCIEVIETAETFDFGEALKLLKQGKKVARKGWNGKGQFVYYVPADRYVAKTDAAKSVMDKDGKVNYRAYLALKTAQGDIATWVPSVSDCLAEDWEVVE